MKIVYRIPPGPGWHPITYLAHLTAELFEAQIIHLPMLQDPSRLAQLQAFVPGRRGAEDCLVLAATPRELLSLYLVPGWRGRFGRIVGWVIDSFWTESVPRVVRLAKPYDHFFVTNDEDVTDWEPLTKRPVTCLPWGTDVLRLGSGGPDRPVDLTRIGRQPKVWDHDRLNREACEPLGLKYQGRTPIPEDYAESQAALAQTYARTKFVLAFSNAVNPAVYTHPTRQYLTARWVDALAGGATVAGVSPNAGTVNRLLWPGALLELPSIDRAEGLNVIREAADVWQPSRAAHNYHMALQRLDWRPRLAGVAETFGVRPPKLMAELDLLRTAVANRVAL